MGGGEGVIVKQDTTLITHIKEGNLNLDGLYSPFDSKDEIVSMVENFLNTKEEINVKY